MTRFCGRGGRAKRPAEMPRRSRSTPHSAPAQGGEGPDRPGAGVCAAEQVGPSSARSCVCAMTVGRTREVCCAVQKPCWPASPGGRAGLRSARRCRAVSRAQEPHPPADSTRHASQRTRKEATGVEWSRPGARSGRRPARMGVGIPETSAFVSPLSSPDDRPRSARAKTAPGSLHLPHVISPPGPAPAAGRLVSSRGEIFRLSPYPSIPIMLGACG